MLLNISQILVDTLYKIAVKLVISAKWLTIFTTFNVWLVRLFLFLLRSFMFCA